MKNEKIMLVIEDERPLVEAITTKLENAGMSAVTARTGEQAFAYLEDLGTIDAIWLDHYLFGKGTGLDFVAKIKGQRSKWRTLPIFIVSNTASRNNVQSYLRLGVTKYYVKAEARLDVIIKEIKSFLNNSKE